MRGDFSLVSNYSIQIDSELDINSKCKFSEKYGNFAKLV